MLHLGFFDRKIDCKQRGDINGMTIVNTTVEKFPMMYKGKKVICFGAGFTGKIICEGFQEQGLLDVIDFFVDNDASKWGKTIEVGGKEFRIVSPECLREEAFQNKIIFITSRFWDQMVEQLNGYNISDNVECYIYILFRLHTSAVKKDLLPSKREIMIPKTIHYCWFGGGELPSFAKECIESWKHFCPDYEIVEWNEKNYDVYKNSFTKEVYDYGHYSALSSYARFDIVNQYGGIYLDTDVEIVKNIDGLLYQDSFMGFEVSNYVNSGHGFGGRKDNPLFAENVEIYDRMTFYNEKGEFHYRNAPSITTEMLVKHGLVLDGSMQRIGETLIYPNDYFDPALQIPVETSYSVHKYSSLWSFGGKDMQRLWQKQREYYYFLAEGNSIEER